MSHNFNRKCDLCNWLLTHCQAGNSNNQCPLIAHLRHIGVLPPEAHVQTPAPIPIYNSNNRQVPPPAHQPRPHVVPPWGDLIPAANQAQAEPVRAQMNWSQYPQGIGGFGGFASANGEPSVLLQPPSNNNFGTAAVGGGGGYQNQPGANGDGRGGFQNPPGVNGGNTNRPEQNENVNAHLNEVFPGVLQVVNQINEWVIQNYIPAEFQAQARARAQAPPWNQNAEPEPSRQSDEEASSTSTSTSSVVIVDERPTPTPTRRPRKPNARDRYFLRTRRGRLLQAAQRRLEAQAGGGGGSGQGQNGRQPGTSTGVSSSTFGIQKGDNPKNVNQEKGESELGQQEVPQRHAVAVVTQCDTDTLEMVTSGSDDSSSEED